MLPAIRVGWSWGGGGEGQFSGAAAGVVLPGTAATATPHQTTLHMQVSRGFSCKKPLQFEREN